MFQPVDARAPLCFATNGLAPENRRRSAGIQHPDRLSLEESQDILQRLPVELPEHGIGGIAQMRREHDIRKRRNGSSPAIGS